MKKAVLTISLLIVISLSSVTYSQPPPGGGSGGSPVGGAAPVGSGLISLVLMGVSYGLVRLRSNNKEETK
jgi:hypothetical protein